MEKKTFELCLEVLRRFENAKILKELILIGSWSTYFYKYYFLPEEYITSIRTNDIDFLIPIPLKFHKNVNVFDMLEDLGFVEEFKGSKGYVKISHPDLTVEFLVPERGKGRDKPYPIPQLSVNAVALRYLDFLAENTISVHVEGLTIKVPHPAAYSLHKFIIFKRRRTIDKHDRDIESALRVFKELIRPEGVFGTFLKVPVLNLQVVPKQEGIVGLRLYTLQFQKSAYGRLKIYR